MGWSRGEARHVAERIEKIKEDLGDWDFNFQRLLEAADGVDLSEVACINVDLLGAGVYLPAKSIATAGLKAAGSVVAHKGVYKLIATVSGVGIVIGLTDTISGFQRALHGNCSEADHLDASADKICALLRVMLDLSKGTDAYNELIIDQRNMLHIEISRWRRPESNYRPGDLTKKVISGVRECDAYFELVLGGGRTRVFERVSAPVSDPETPWRLRVCPGVQQDAAVRVVTRLTAADDTCHISAYAERSFVTRSTLGDSKMGSTHHVDLVKVTPDGQVNEYWHDLGAGGMISLSCGVR
jgi:hypothetical protein